MDEVLSQWRDPVFGESVRDAPLALAERLRAMADELTAGEDVAEAIARATIPAAPALRRRPRSGGPPGLPAP
ncbi:MAG: hypothetical protein JO027_01335 [Solirubrobacterales bacterium]|nr:hypothetical protein [Solirubrobacterales bacterium]